MELERFQCPECDAVSSQNASCEACNTGVEHLHRCAWCVQWSPTDDYCVHCGSVMVPAEKFYAARVLKQQGVNQLSISLDLDKIDEAQLALYQQQFQKQNGLIKSIITAVGLCQDLLYFKSYVDEFSRRLIKSLPLGTEDEKRYADLFANMPESPAECLLILSASQQCPDLMQIAQLALVRQEDLLMDSAQAKKWYERVAEFAAGDSEYVFEALIALGHWRIWVAPFFIDQFKGEQGRKIYNASYTKLHTADGEIAQWMAVVCARTEYFAQGKAPSKTKKLVKKYLKKNIQSSDRDLKVASAMLLGDTAVLASYIDDDNQSLRQVAISILAKQGSEKIVPVINSSIESDNKDCLLVIIDALMQLGYKEQQSLPSSIVMALINTLESAGGYTDQVIELLGKRDDFYENYFPDLLSKLMDGGGKENHKVDLAVSLLRHGRAEDLALLKPVLVKISREISHLEQLALLACDFDFDPEVSANLNRVTRKLLGSPEFQTHAQHITKIYQQQMNPANPSGFIFLQFLMEHLLHQNVAVSNDAYSILGDRINDLLLLDKVVDSSNMYCFSIEQCETCFGSVDSFIYAATYILQHTREYQCASWLSETLINSRQDFREAVAANPVAARHLVAALLDLVNIESNDKLLRTAVTQYICAPASNGYSPLLEALSFEHVSEAFLEVLTAASEEYVFPRQLLIELLQYYEIDQRAEFVERIKVILMNQCSRTPMYAYISYSYLIKASMDLDNPAMANAAADIFFTIRNESAPYQSVKDHVTYAINDLKGVIASFFDSSRDFIEQAGAVFSSFGELKIESWLYELLIEEKEYAGDLYSQNNKLLAALLGSLAQAIVREKYSRELTQKALECLSIYIEYVDCYKQIKNDTINVIKIAMETTQVTRYTLSQISQFYSEMLKYGMSAQDQSESETSVSRKKHRKTKSLSVAMPSQSVGHSFEVSDKWLRQFAKVLKDQPVSSLMPVLGHFHNYGYEFKALIKENSQVRVQILDALIELLFSDGASEGSGKDEYLSQRLLSSEIIHAIAFHSEDASYCISRLRNKLSSSNGQAKRYEYVTRLIENLSEHRVEKHGQSERANSEVDVEMHPPRAGHVGNLLSKLSLPAEISPEDYESLRSEDKMYAQVRHACELAVDGDFITSVKLLKLALRVVDSDIIYYLIARVFIMHDLADQASRYLQQCLVRNPSHCEALELYAKIQQVVYHDYNFSLELAKRVLALKPDSVNTLTRLGSICIRLGDFANATRYIQQAMKVDVKAPDIYYQLGEILFRTQRFREAINNYKKAASCGKRDAETYSAIAKASLLIHDRDSAIRYFKTATEVDDTYDEAFYGLGRLFLKNHEYKSADYYLSRAVELDEHNETYAWELALTCKERGEKERAFVLMEGVASGSSVPAKVLQGLAVLCMEKASWYEAQDYYEKAIAVEPENYQLYYQLAESYGKTESWGNAVGILQRAIDLKPNFVEALRKSATIYFSMERFPQAQAFYERVLEIDPICTTSSINLGYICNLKGDYKLAAECLIPVLKRDNKNAVAHCYYATTLSALKEYKKSTKHFEKAIELNPEYSDAYINLGHAYYHAKNYDEAARSFSRGAELDGELEGIEETLSKLVNQVSDSQVKSNIQSILGKLH